METMKLQTQIDTAWPLKHRTLFAGLSIILRSNRKVNYYCWSKSPRLLVELSIINLQWLPNQQTATYCILPKTIYKKNINCSPMFIHPNTLQASLSPSHSSANVPPPPSALRAVRPSPPHGCRALGRPHGGARCPEGR